MSSSWAGGEGPPRAARRLVAALLPAEDRASFVGELDELYHVRVRRGGSARARWWYRRQVLDLALRRTAQAVRSLFTSLRRGADMDAVGRDLTYALRRLARTPAFTLVAVLSLALGIGANTALFSVVNAVLLREPPFRDADRLVEVYTAEEAGTPYSTSSIPDYRDLAAASADVFEGVVGSQTLLVRTGDAATGQQAFGEAVSGNTFAVLGIPAVLGRTLTAADDGAAGADPVVVIGHGFWTRVYGSDSAAVGRTLLVNQRPYTIVGVAAPWYTGTFPALRTDLWVPLSMVGELTGGTLDRKANRGSRSMFLKARLVPGVDADEARAFLQRFSAELATRHPDTNRARTMSLLPSRDVAIHPVVDGALRPVAALLLGVAGLVLLIACTNLASFLLARAEARRAEIAVRLSLGARRSALVRQLLIETVVLAGLGGAGALLLAGWVVDLLVGFRPPIPIPLGLDFPLDARVLAYTGGVALLAGVLFGLAPALQGTRTDLAGAMRADGGRGVTGTSRLRAVMVTGQVALSLALLVGSGLFVRSLREAQGMDPGFYTGPGALLMPQLDLTGMSEGEGRAFWDAVVGRLEARPEIEGVALTDNLPLGFNVQTIGVGVPGQTSERNDGRFDVDVTRVSATFFDVLEVPILSGRGFVPSDREGPQVAVVSEAFARRFFPGEEPVGRTVATGRDEVARIVGVARDTKVRSLGEAPRPRIYFSADQQYLTGMQIVVRGPGGSAELLRVARTEAMALRPDRVLFDQRTMEEHLAIHLFPPRMAALLLSVFGGLALLLAGVGIWGVVSHAVARRTREVGIRVSLGATAGEVVRLLVGSGMKLVAVGIAGGLVLAAGLGLVLARFLYGVGALDPVTFVGIPVLLAGVALLAAWVPARRAARVDPVRALRTE